MIDPGSHHQSFLEAGALISGRYEVERLLGAGGTGYVVLTRDKKFSDAPVVVKLLYSHLVQNETAYRRFRNETAIAFDLTHPNIVQSYSFEVWGEIGYYITMEYLPNGSLHDTLSPPVKGDCDTALLLARLLPVMKALDYAHKRGVVHRDIKPHNLLLAADNEVKVADFGLSQMLWGEVSLTRAGDMLGTPHYMSPEQFESKAIDTRSDIYSLGITAFELIAAQPPFEAAAMYELAMHHLNSPLPSLTDFGIAAPEWLQEFLERCCAKQPKGRFQSIEEAGEYLAAHEQCVWTASAADLPAGALEENTDKLRALAATNMKKRVFFLLFLLAPAFLALYSRRHPPLRRRVATAILYLENALRSDLPLLKSAFGVTVVRGDRSAFFDQARERQVLWPLLDTGMDANFKNDYGETPLHYYTKGKRVYNSPVTIQKLIRNGADVNSGDSAGVTPLHNCIQNSWPLCVEILLKAGADPNLADDSGATPLEYAIRYSSIQIVRELLEAGADPRLNTAAGGSLVKLAEEIGAPEASALLERYAEQPSAGHRR